MNSSEIIKLTSQLILQSSSRGRKCYRSWQLGPSWSWNRQSDACWQLIAKIQMENIERKKCWFSEEIIAIAQCYSKRTKLKLEPRNPEPQNLRTNILIKFFSLFCRICRFAGLGFLLGICLGFCTQILICAFLIVDFHRFLCLLSILLQDFPAVQYSDTIFPSSLLAWSFYFILFFSIFLKKKKLKLTLKINSAYL